jgi:hypothetical protein
MRRALSSLLVLGLAGVACRDQASLLGTAVLLTTERGGLEVDQLRYEAWVDGGALFEPALRPEPAAGPLATSTSMRLLLPDSLDQQVVDLRVTGLLDGVPRAEGAGRVTVVGGLEVPTTVRLSAPGSSCGDGAPCAAGLECLQRSCQCTSASCSGCCLGGWCQVGTAAATCGTRGLSCVDCRAVLTDRCRSSGTCGCGSGGACSAGQICNAGVCQCNPATCAGCCKGTTCEAGTSRRECGKSGAACVSCSGESSDCEQGVCR